MQKIDISEIKDFKIGQAQDNVAATGCSVIICEQGAVCGVDVRGGSPGTLDTDALNPVNNRKVVHAIILSGGSSFGIDSASGVRSFLEEKKIGRDVGVTIVPNVCGAILFDLKCGSSHIRPDKKMGYAACVNAYEELPMQHGNYGAGMGATLGTSLGPEHAMKGGIGSHAYRHEELLVGAIVAVNCVGDIYDPNKGRIIAGARNGNEFAISEEIILNDYKDHSDFYSGNTVIGCIVTNAQLTKAEATKLASIAHNGLARTIRPAHTVYDGDSLFTMCTGKVHAKLDAVAILAVKAVEEAILTAVTSAETFDQYLSANDFNKS